jgi:threonine dehydrogenase-like Zn-dependent dehydrogenase
MSNTTQAQAKTKGPIGMIMSAIARMFGAVAHTAGTVEKAAALANIYMANQVKLTLSENNLDKSNLDENQATMDSLL